MKTIITSLFLVSAFVLFGQKPLVYKGKIGSYPIEVQFTKCDTITGKFEGKYRYAKQKTFINLSGQLFENVIEMDEIVGKDTTGTWYLEYYSDSLLGYWAGKTKGFEVDLGYVSGKKSLLDQESIIDLSEKTSSKITGTYQVNYYFINVMWMDEQNYTPEVGYNGGTVSIQEIDDKQIEFGTEIICGPTYHFAIASGTAIKEGDSYVYKNEDGCEITIKIKDKLLEISANKGSFECGFGARAYLDHSLIKVSDKADFSEH